MGKITTRKKIFRQCAFFSLFWSCFYAIRVAIYVVSYRNRAVDEAVEWQVLQAMLSLMGVLVSCSMFNAYKKDGSIFLMISWLTWMFANFTLSLILLHMSLFELLSTSRLDTVHLVNNVLDVSHIINAPGSIYFILVFLVHSMLRHHKSGDVLFNTAKDPNGYERLSKYEVLHLHEGLDEDEVVYYV